jgi:hypothetical protein
LALQHFQAKKNRSNKIQSAQFTDLKKSPQHYPALGFIEFVKLIGKRRVDDASQSMKSHFIKSHVIRRRNTN